MRRVHLGYLEEEVGSVVCLWILACWLSLPLRAVCTSAGMSGDVWLIFMAASRSLTELRPFALTSRGYFFSISTALHSAGGGEPDRGTSGKPRWRLFSTWADRALLLQIGQHSFQNTKRETTKRARPQKPTTTARRLTEMSTCNQGGTHRDTQARMVASEGQNVTDKHTREKEKVIKQDSIKSLKTTVKDPERQENHMFSDESRSKHFV